MARFIDHYTLGHEVITLFREATDIITIVSPFIKLHENIRRELEKKIDDPKFFIEVLYGKNERDLSKSLSHEDLSFFKKFQNVEIRYNKDLHAKYYANESKSIITSLNLHEYSIKNNIEVGVMFERSTLSILGDNSNDSDASKYFGDIIDSSEVVFSQQAKEKKSFFGLIRTSDGTEILEDNSVKMYTKQKQKSSVGVSKMGYCIRTREKIPFNLKKPYSAKAFASWNQYKNKEYKEKYCHYSGEKSNGKTTFSKPILAANWKEASGKT